ncbi:hypothetical protein LCGC14_2438690, partial [marine sediment metagenome]
FKGDVAAEFLGTSTRAELYNHAHRVWKAGLNTDELIAILETNRADRV